MPRRRYPSDLTNAQWAVLEPLVPAPGPGDRPTPHPGREIVDALLSVRRDGIPWRALPHDFPQWPTVYDESHRWRDDGARERIHDVLREQVRPRASRHAQPSAAILESQRARPMEKVARGDDGGKNVRCRKRHLLGDTTGLLRVVVHPANIPDRVGGATGPGWAR